MIIDCWSDLHTKEPTADEFDVIGDVLVVAGDLLYDPYDVYTYKKMLTAIGQLPQKHKIVIPGNHDPDAHQFHQSYLTYFAQDNGVNILIDKSTTIDGVKFYGFPWTTKFGEWNWMHSEKILERFAAAIDADVDVLISHGPPSGILDETYNGLNVGSTELRKRIEVIKPKLVVFGHIHEGHGWVKHDSITYVNAAYGYSREQFPPITARIKDGVVDIITETK